jgi:S1-C subfamily serine protease
VEDAAVVPGDMIRCPGCGQGLKVNPPKPPQEHYVIRNEGEDVGTSLWRNPAVYIAFAAIAAIVVGLIIVATPRNPVPPQQAASALKGSLSGKVAEEPGKAPATPLLTGEQVLGLKYPPTTPKVSASQSAVADPLDNILQHPPTMPPAQPASAPAPMSDNDLLALHGFGPIAQSATPAQPAPSATLTPEALFAKAAPAVVKITAYTAQGECVGTGFYASEDGLIVTNYHVVEGATWVSVSISVAGPGKEIPLGVSLTKNGPLSQVPGFCDPQADLAVFRAPHPQRQKTAHLELTGVASRPNIGARVYTIGNPHELDKTLSDGLISGFREWDNGLTVIQTTVPISGGSSGGPLMDTTGCVVGVIFASEKGGQNINYAVPADKVRALVERAKAGIAKGEAGNLEQELLKSGHGGLAKGAVREDGVSLARAALSQNDLAGALRILQGLKDGDPQNAEVWLLLAQTQFFMKNPEPAIDSANRAVTLKPDYFDAYGILSAAFSVTRRYDLQLSAANTMVRLRPADCAGYSELGSALSSLDRHWEAANAYETAVRLASDGSNRKCYHLNLAGEYETLGRVQEAITSLKKILAIAPEDFLTVYAHEALIRCYLATGNRLAAQRSYDALKKLDPQKAAEISPPLAPARR